MIKNKKPAIFVLSPFIYPEPISTGKYNTHLVEALVRKGCSVEVIASHPIYPDWKSKRTTQVLDGVKIYRGGGFLHYAKSMVLRRIQLEVGFALHTIRHSLFKRNIDVVIPVFPPSLFFFLISLVLPQTAKKIGIVHDIQGVMASLSKSPFQKKMIRFIRFLEKKSFASCDKLIFLSKSMADRAINDYGLDPDKILVFYPFTTIEKRETIDNALGHLFSSAFKHIVYSGAIGEKQNPHALLKLFQAIVHKRTDVLCHIFSRGPLFDELMKADSPNVEKVLFHDLVSEENLYELYLRSDIQVIPQKNGTSEGAIPSKLPNIISAGTPIFSISDPGSELSQIVRKSGIGYCADSWDIENLVSELNDFFEVTKKNSHHERQLMVRNYVNKSFGIDQLVDTIMKNNGRKEAQEAQE